MEVFEVKKLILTFTCVALAIPCAAESTASSNEPEGFLTCSAVLARDIFQIEKPQAKHAPSRPLWDGNNPFHQPAATTDYYGSGDVDNDGTVTSADLSYMQDMANGTRAPSPKADVDCDGDVDNNDVSLINSALGGGTLPGWWNSLTSGEERNAWVTKCLAIDQTDEHVFRYWFACGSFATQVFVHCSYYYGDLHPTFLDGGPTVFNLPVYIVTVNGHALNAILVGDDPLNFEDWRFFEPQSDRDVRPGKGIPHGSIVRILVPSKLTSTGFACSPSTKKLDFYIDETGWTLQYRNPNLILTRPAPPMDGPGNRHVLRNARIVPTAQGMILFERTRQDMSRTTDIHLADLPFVNPQLGSPLILSSQYSRLLDLSQGPDGTIHLLWKGKPNYIPGLFHGKLDPIKRQVTDVTRVSTGPRQVRMGRVVITTAGEVHVFWLELKPTGSSHHYESGIYWTCWTGSEWQSEQNIAPYTSYASYYDYCEWDKPDLLQYYFDADVSKGGHIILVWAEPTDSADEAIIHQLRYNGQWGTMTDIETTNACGIELVADSVGTLHMAYWSGEWSDDGRANVLHRISDDNGFSWSAPETVGAAGNAGRAQLPAGAEGAVYQVWETQVDRQVIPIWNKYENGAWHAAQILSVRVGANAGPPATGFVAGRLWCSSTVIPFY
jgi:hypothetical protein